MNFKYKLPKMRAQLYISNLQFAVNSPNFMEEKIVFSTLLIDFMGPDKVHIRCKIAI